MKTQIRYKVIADYPDSVFKLGQIIEQEEIEEGQNLYNMNFFEGYPHLFQKLEWWEDVHKKDMPLYFKTTDPLNGEEGGSPYFGRIGAGETGAKWDYFDGQLLGVHYNNGGGTMIHYLLPATKEEFENYQKANL